VSLFGLLNFLVLQWFGIRLGASWSPSEIPGWSRISITDEEVRELGGRWWSRTAPPRDVRIRWIWLRWIWPLTGWWSEYRWIGGERTARAALARMARP
jgi:hypothetical protein